MNMKSNGHYPTTDLSLATFLIASGQRLITILYEDRRATFLFEQTKELQGFVDLFMSGEAQIPISKYEFIRGNLLDRVKRGA